MPRLLAASLILIAAVSAVAAPHRPSSDAQVLERLPSRANDPIARELTELRSRWQRDPSNLDVAVDLARRYFEQAGVEGDPRYVGYAQAALEPWWTQTGPPLSARVMRAVVLQYSHRFDDALADLEAVVRAEPEEVDAWAWLAAIHTVRADYESARRACDQLAPLAERLIGVGCAAYVDSLTGHAAAAARALRQALGEDRGAEPGQRLWALTRLAEIDQRRGDNGRAEAAYREALALGQRDVYLLAAYADFLLDQGRPAEVLTLLQDLSRADVLLLRLALAAKAAGDPRLAGWTRELEARFDATRARGDTTHRKEEARFALAVLGQADRAVALARDNYAEQREVADARILLEAAWAARQRQAAQPVLDWMARWQIESTALKALAERWVTGR